MKAPFLPAILAFILFFQVASATLVTTSTDEDDGSLGGGTGFSLREAVKYSAAGDTITFDPALSGQIIRLSFGSLVIEKSLTIDASALPKSLTLSADRTGNGKTSDDTYAILHTGGDLILDSLVLTGANCGESSGCITIRPSVNFTLALDHCTLTGNAGYHASALYCADYQARPTDAITIRNSTIAANTVTKGPAALNVFYCSLTIQNSTFSQNQTGAISFGSGGPLSTFSISNSTIIGNPASFGAGGLYLNLKYNRLPCTVFVNNTICTGNTPANISISPEIIVTGTNNLTSGDPRLAPLGDYGGPTQTMPPLTTSPAIDAGGATPLTTDQRGLPRDGKPDIGAVEYQGTRNLAAPTLDPAGDATLSFGTPPSTPGFAWVLSRSPDLSPGSYREIYRYQGGADIAASGTTFVRTAAFITITDANAPAESGYYRIGLVPVP